MTNTNTSQMVYADQPEEQRLNFSYSVANIMGIFFDECETLLQNLDASLIAVSKGDSDKDTIEIIFHSIHSVHEGAAALSLTDLQDFAKIFDCTLNKMCSNQRELTHSVFQTLLQSSTMLGKIFTATRDNKTYDKQLAENLMQALKDCLKQPISGSLLNVAQDTTTIEDLDFQPIMLDFDFCNTPL